MSLNVWSSWVPVPSPSLRSFFFSFHFFPCSLLVFFSSHFFLIILFFLARKVWCAGLHMFRSRTPRVRHRTATAATTDRVVRPATLHVCMHENTCKCGEPKLCFPPIRGRVYKKKKKSRQQSNPTTVVLAGRLKKLASHYYWEAQHRGAIVVLHQNARGGYGKQAACKHEHKM